MASPEFIRSLMCDKLTAYTACQAVTSALYMREKNGAGQHIDLSMLDAGLFFLFPDAYQNHTLLDTDIEVQPLLTDILYQMTKTKDGGITISAATEKQRDGVWNTVGLEEYKNDPRFNSIESLLSNMDVYRQLLSDAFLTLTTDDALSRLQANDVPCARCHTLDEALAQEQLSANQSIEIQDHPLMGAVRMMKSPARFGGEVPTPGAPCPAHGENTLSVLASFGITEDYIQTLTNESVIA
jgi:crotonobetainyl-CoA:carnitine CoA-transferase CaiB-like acyl-CoA transferase